MVIVHKEVQRRFDVQLRDTCSTLLEVGQNWAPVQFDAGHVRNFIRNVLDVTTEHH